MESTVYMYNWAENFVVEKTSDECLGLSYEKAYLLAAKGIPKTFFCLSAVF